MLRILSSHRIHIHISYETRHSNQALIIGCQRMGVYQRLGQEINMIHLGQSYIPTRQLDAPESATYTMKSVQSLHKVNTRNPYSYSLFLDVKMGYHCC